MTRVQHVAAAAGAALALAGVSAQQQPRTQQPRPILILGGTLVDGGEARRNDAILIADGRIKRAGLDAARRPPRDVRTIDATDKWILPGLIDGHVHFFQTGGIDARPDIVPHPTGRPYRDVVDEIRRTPQPYLRSYICSGVTSVVDPGGPMWGFDLRDSREDDPLSPRIAFSGPLLATYDPKPLELENDEPIWLMKDAARVRGLVDRLAPRRPDMVKIWFVHRQGDDLAAQSALVREAIAAIHAKKLRAAVHATALETARIAVDAGADILVHSVGDRAVDQAFIDAVIRRRVIYVPTLIVGRSYREVLRREVEFEPFEKDCAPPATIASFALLPKLTEGSRPPSPDQFPLQAANLKRLADAGAIVAAGTDAGNTRTLHGPSLHREMALMAEAGLRPLQILEMATRNGARMMGREREVGQIKEGMLADVVILDADPLADIRNTRRVSTVIKGGAIYER